MVSCWQGHRHGGGDIPLVWNSSGMSPQNLQFLKSIFGIFAKTFGFSNISKLMWAKSEEKSEFAGMWFWLTWIHPPSQDLPPPSQKFVATPLHVSTSSSETAMFHLRFNVEWQSEVPFVLFVLISTEVMNNLHEECPSSKPTSYTVRIPCKQGDTEFHANSVQTLVNIYLRSDTYFLLFIA